VPSKRWLISGFGMADNTRQQLFSLSPTSSLTHFPFSASLHALPPTNSMRWLLYMTSTRLAATSSSFFFDRCSQSVHPTQSAIIAEGCSPAVHWNIHWTKNGQLPRCWPRYANRRRCAAYPVHFRCLYVPMKNT
jgi:hypothetical protein